MNISVMNSRHNYHPSSCNYVYVSISRIRMTVKEKEKTIGIINKEVDSIGHRSILNDEPVRIFFFFS